MDIYNHLLVQNSPYCVKLLKFIDHNIQLINAAGMYLKIEKVQNVSNNKTLKQRNIKGLPALLTSEGKHYVGYSSIVELMQTKIRRPSNNDPNDIRSYWMNNMYDVDTNGKKYPKKDADEEDDEAKDLEKKIREYNRAVPNHRKTPGKQHIEQTPKFDTNIEPVNHKMENTSAPIHKSSCLDAIGGDATDRAMMSAWLDNIPNDYE